VKLSAGTAPWRRHEPNPAAHEAYLKARYIWEKLTPGAIDQAKEYLEKAILLDREYALAHCGLADCYLPAAGAGYMPAREALPLMRDQARMALESDPELPEAHAMMGIAAGLHDYDWKEAERQFGLAMVHDPVPARVNSWYGMWHLLPLGRTQEALVYTEKGLKEDPLSVTAHYMFACCLLDIGRLADVQAVANRVLEFREDHWLVSYLLTVAYAAREKWAEALHFAEKASPFFLPATGVLAGALQRMGEANRAEELLRKLMPGEAYCAPLALSCFHHTCGETDKAADWMEKSIDQRHPFDITDYYIRRSLRASPRWPALARMMNLPEDVR